MKRNAVVAQHRGIARWLTKFGGRRASEAAMEVTTMPTGRRRSFFRSLVAVGSLEWRGGEWHAVKDITRHLEPETIAAYIDGGLGSLEFTSANAHLAECPGCTAVLANTVKTKQELAK